jgi:hypothetical protein
MKNRTLRDVDLLGRAGLHRYNTRCCYVLSPIQSVKVFLMFFTCTRTAPANHTEMAIIDSSYN